MSCLVLYHTKRGGSMNREQRAVAFIHFVDKRNKEEEAAAGEETKDIAIARFFCEYIEEHWHEADENDVFWLANRAQRLFSSALGSGSTRKKERRFWKEVREHAGYEDLRELASRKLK